MKKTAFTLIELMLVVIIIGVLAAMVMPRLVGRSEEARITVARSAVQANIPVALDMFEIDMGHYPGKLDDLLTNPDSSTQWKGPYIKKDRDLKDPWGRAYKYELLSDDNKDYKLCSPGPDENKSEDDICNN
ncbi:MAG: type II secretion system major pseudopilin GspG [Candidatus Omnitrophica bacterium]|nr:type II secretion system major pseudopilin GspG [Candidatus Omnitrophota bacterium]